MEIVTIHLDLQPRQRLCHFCPLEPFWRGTSQGNSFVNCTHSFLISGLLWRMYPGSDRRSLSYNLTHKRLGPKVPTPRSDRVPRLARNHTGPLIHLESEFCLWIGPTQCQKMSKSYNNFELNRISVRCIFAFKLCFIFKVEVRQWNLSPSRISSSVGCGSRAVRHRVLISAVWVAIRRPSEPVAGSWRPWIVLPLILTASSLT